MSNETFAPFTRFRVSYDPPTHCVSKPFLVLATRALGRTSSSPAAAAGSAVRADESSPLTPMASSAAAPSVATPTTKPRGRDSRGSSPTSACSARGFGCTLP